MLTALLRALSQGRPRTMTELAAELGSDPVRLTIAFELCERLGYLERQGVGCDVGSCGRCAAACACGAPTTDSDSGPPAGPTRWRLTESGLRVARPPSSSAYA